MSKKAVPETERTLPHNLEAERAVLGAALLRPDGYESAADLLQPSDFFRQAHGLAFAAMGRLAAANAPIELVTLKEELLRSGLLEEVGGPAYLGSLVDGVPRSTNIAAYAGIVIEKSRLRDTIRQGQALVAAAYGEQSPVADLASDAAERLHALGLPALAAQATMLSDLVPMGMAALEEASTRGTGGVTGLRTGFTDLDALTSGLQGGHLVLVAARTSQGKTALAMNIARQIATAGTTLVFSLEMSREELFMRMLSSEARVDSHRLKTAMLYEADWDRISKAVCALAELPIAIIDAPNLGVREVLALARQVRLKHGLGAIVIDYIQLMRGRGMFDNRTQEIGTISRGLKAVARELGVPVVALSQLSRASEAAPGRKARRPQLSDLAESGSLENDADVVLLIYRPEPKDDDSTVVAEVIVAKQRNGPTGTVRLCWRPEYVRFENLAL